MYIHFLVLEENLSSLIKIMAYAKQPNIFKFLYLRSLSKIFIYAKFVRFLNYGIRRLMLIVFEGSLVYDVDNM